MTPEDFWLEERASFREGYRLIRGVDEAGCGPLAGPVYAAAVILPEGWTHPYLNDSKKVTERRRELLFDTITASALAYGIASADEKEIDALNILRARLLAMRRAVEALSPAADFALVDGNRAPGLSVPCRTLVGGDGRSASIAAASILAKVSRDRFMAEMALRYPQYRFEKHKGYPTKLHYELLREYGPSPIHRLTFLKNL